MKFIYADELKKKYSVYGEFYNLKYEDGMELKCRKLLIIINKNYVNKLDLKSKPDAVFIMINPGKSKPLDENVKQVIINEEEVLDEGIVNIPLVPIQPDVTQYQIMRVMEVEKWNYVRIINLSDVRQANSKEFYEFVSETENSLHSIFDKRRKRELEQYIVNKQNKVIAAWGKDKALDKLINLAISSNMINERIGVNSENDKKHYNHSSPQIQQLKEEWLRDIICVIDESK